MGKIGKQFTFIYHYVDIETCEKITKEDYHNYYYTIKTIKNVKQPSRTSSARIIETTKYGRRKPTQLEFTN